MGQMRGERIRLRGKIGNARPICPQNMGIDRVPGKVGIGQHDLIAVSHAVDRGEQFGAEQRGYTHEHFGLLSKVKIGGVARVEALAHSHQLLLAVCQSVKPFWRKFIVGVNLKHAHAFAIVAE